MTTTLYGGIVSGSIGAALAATLDYARAGAELARFLPTVRWPLWLFLAALYTAVLAPVAAASAVALRALRWHSILRPLLDRSPAAPNAAVSHISRLRLVAVLLFLWPLTGLALYRPALIALSRFHHRGLIALLLSIEGTALVLAAAAIAVLALTLLQTGESSHAGPAPSAAPGLHIACRGPLSVYSCGLAAGLMALLWALSAVAGHIQQLPRLAPPTRALYIAAALPILLLPCLGTGWLLGHGTALYITRSRPHLAAGALDRPLACLLLPLLPTVAAVLVIAQGQRDALRILDLRPFTTMAFAVLVALAALALWSSPRLAPRHRAWAAVLCMPFLAWGLALHLGEREPVRKAALALAPVSERLVALQTVLFDLDSDGAAGRWAVGGSDCDDLDAARYPGAFDWPDNHVDENCNGHDATTRHAADQTPPLPPPAAPLPTRPNVVLLTIDALRADHVSTYGSAHPTTPNLDALAADPDGVVFDSAWAHAPSTRYSVPAILTGRYPSTIQWGPPHVHWPPEVLPENRLLSQMLRDRGYATTALLSYHYFEPSWGLARGFDDYDTHLMVLHSMGGDPAATSGSSARELSDLAISKLPALMAGGKPFFLWIHYYDPHFRYDRHPLQPGQQPFGDREPDLYDEEIRYTDHHIGRVLSALRESPAWAQTTLAVTADHGEGFGEHGIPPDRRHGYHLYANQTRVPLILRIAGLRRSYPAVPRRVPIPAGHVDLVPTLLQIALGQPPQTLETQLLGQSLLPWIAAPAGGTPGDRVVFQEVMYEGPTVRKALVTPRWHLVHNLIPDGTTELYDLTADPDETRDLATDAPAVRQTLLAQLSAWMDDSAVPPDFAARVADRITASPPNLATPLDAQIGRCLQVVSSSAQPAVAPRGGRFTFDIAFRARCRVPAGYRLFVHLRSQGGPFVNADHDFLDGLLPPDRLPTGQFVRDQTQITVPPWFPPGPATLEIGLFQRSERLPVSGPAAIAPRDAKIVIAAHVQVQAP